MDASLLLFHRGGRGGESWILSCRLMAWIFNIGVSVQRKIIFINIIIEHYCFINTGVESYLRISIVTVSF